jgi:UDP-glucuronate 4-epimerase
MDVIETIEKELGQKAIKNFLPMQSGDVKDTLTDTSLLENWIDYRPLTTVEDGINKFIHWYKYFYKEF